MPRRFNDLTKNLPPARYDTPLATPSDASQRLSCSDALTHAWLSEGAQQANNELGEAAQKHRRRSTLRRGSALTVDPEALASLRASHSDVPAPATEG